MSDCLRCSIQELVRSTLDAILLRFGCTAAEAAQVEVDCQSLAGIHPPLASIRAGGREVYRIGSLEELDNLAHSGVEGQMLTRSVRRVLFGD